MKAYSVDLRQRVVEAVDGGMPRPEAARRFRVSVATIKRYLKRRRETGSLTPGQSPGRPPEIAPAQYAALAAQVAARPDDTLAQHAATWRAEQGAAVSPWAVDRALGRAKITRKKSR
jgi:transposase